MSDKLNIVAEWITVQSACEMLGGVSDSTIRKLVRNGDLKAAQLRGKNKAWGRLLINKQSLASLIEKGEVHATTA
jgi:excisionase family DNA binding protein